MYIPTPSPKAKSASAQHKDVSSHLAASGRNSPVLTNRANRVIFRRRTLELGWQRSRRRRLEKSFCETLEWCDSAARQLN